MASRVAAAKTGKATASINDRVRLMGQPPGRGYLLGRKITVGRDEQLSGPNLLKSLIIVDQRVILRSSSGDLLKL